MKNGDHDRIFKFNLGLRITVSPPPLFNPYALRPSNNLPFPLEESRCRIFHLARQGLFMGIKELGLKPGDEILVPAYHHGSEIEALVRAGIVCRFYGGGQRLEPDEEELEALLGTRVRALHLIHYLGLPQDAARWRAWCDEHDLLLIEDAAQAWLSSRDGVPVGSYGDLAIFCLYKTFGLPDGAAVISNPPTKPPPDRRHLGINRVARRYASYLVQRWGWLAELRWRLKRHGSGHESGPDFELGSPGPASYATTAFLVPRVVYPAAQTTRASNYAFLLEQLERFVPEPFAHLPEGASPYVFPIQSDRKEKLLEQLDLRGVGAWDKFWAVPHPCLPAEKFPRAAALRKSILALPVHQELSFQELERIIDAVRGVGSTQVPRHSLPGSRQEQSEADSDLLEH
jgi:hypothetical protein